MKDHWIEVGQLPEKDKLVLVYYAGAKTVSFATYRSGFENWFDSGSWEWQLKDTNNPITHWQYIQRPDDQNKPH